MPFVLLVSVDRLMDGGSREEGRVGGLLVDVGKLGAMVIQVFVVYPNLVSRLWKVKSRDKRPSP
uniref:Uncharacterized protein n=1 Tax=Arundo donax TaxID=35708 RepID=A0A0A9FV55_ARUDO